MINNILKKIEKANEVQNVELEKHEVDLGIVDDLKAQFNKYFSVYNADLLELEIVDAVKKLNTNYTASAKEFSNFDKIYNEFRKKALDLGVDIPKDVVNYKNEVFKFMENATAIHKKYLNIK
jgi:hypothetical protein